MCGLVGIAGKLAYKDEAVMKRLLVLDVFRGIDATGLAAVRKNGDVHISKLSSHPFDLFEMPSFKTALNGLVSSAFIGHNRAATVGNKTTFNAHPFHFGSIVGAHNGTLGSENVRILDDILGEKYPVDSMSLIAAIDKVGVEEAISKLHEGKDGTTGAWSLVWFDSNDNTVNFLRNKHRPLYYGFNEECDRIYWASEWEMIQAATTLSNYTHEPFVDDEGYKYFATTPGVLYSFSIDDLAKGGKKRPKAVAKECVSLPPKEPTYAPFVQRGGTTGGTTGSTTTTSRHGSNADNVVSLWTPLNNPLADVITVEKFNELAKYGCSFCGEDVAIDDPGITIYDRDDILLCSNCSRQTGETPSTRIYLSNIDKAL